MIVCHTVGNWGFYSIINMMPKFMGNYQQYDVKQIGWMSAIPYLLQTVTVLGATWFSDFLRVSFKGVTRFEIKNKIRTDLDSKKFTFENHLCCWRQYFQQFPC